MLKISINHTQQLIQKGAKEYGAQNSLLHLHKLIYGLVRDTLNFVPRILWHLFGLIVVCGLLKFLTKIFNILSYMTKDCGHLPPQITFVNGSYGTIEYADGKGKLIQAFI